MIKPASWTGFISRGRPSKAQVVDFAAAEGIAPGIVVGWLQHEGLIPYKHMNDLKVPLTWG